jgi:hypothetical protein
MTAQGRFSDHVCQKLKHYVYRLIDPRNGTTFYVGRGQGNRVFDHAAGKQPTTDAETAESLKLKVIGAIKKAGLDVQHVIHRHGMDECSAREVEAALIEAYPGLTNIQPGEDSSRGVMHATEVRTLYDAPIAQPHHKLLLINVNRSCDDHAELLDAVRYAWKIDLKKATQADFVLAIQRGLIIGVFVAEKWLPATVQNFSALFGMREGYGPREGRYGFVGKEAPVEVRKLYCLKRLPDAERKKGAANPIHYWNM